MEVSNRLKLGRVYWNHRLGDYRTTMVIVPKERIIRDIKNMLCKFNRNNMELTDCIYKIFELSHIALP